jgi:hypothetical protein
MRHSLTLIPFLVALLSAPLSYAAATPSDPCTLLDWHDFQFIGVTENGGLSSVGWHEETTPPELPGTRLSTALCSAAAKTDAGRTVMTLTLTSLKGKVTEQQFTTWLKSVATLDARENEKDVKEIKIGDSDCESGRDVLTLPSDYADLEKTIVEHFVACDQHVGLLHVSINAQVAEGRKKDLPSPEQVKALLDKSLARLKRTSFRTPD